MKNISILINIVLLAAVIYLFVEVNKIKHADTTVSAQPLSVGGAPASIVYINTDTLLEHYDFYKNMKSDLEKKQETIDALIETRGKQLETEINSYREKAATMGEADRGKEEERLGKKQEDLVQMRKEMLAGLSKEEDKMNDSLHNSLISCLKDFNKGKNYKFILGYQKGGGILLAEDSLNITKQVIDVINRKK
jgi:outer membrane protein